MIANRAAAMPIPILAPIERPDCDVGVGVVELVAGVETPLVFVGDVRAVEEGADVPWLSVESSVMNEELCTPILLLGDVVVLEGLAEAIGVAAAVDVTGESSKMPPVYTIAMEN
jgi:hypothetical protein